MFFKHFYDPDLAQGSYLIGCQASGEAVVVDARRDVDVYLKEAAAQGLTITDVTETHIHADYLSGSRELAARTGARLWLSDMGDADWKYAFEGEKLHDGDEIRIGNVILRAVHTPGHTPEHLSFLVVDGATSEEPHSFLTGDFVFVGDVGRPDLLDEAAGGVDTRFVGAKQLFASLRDRFLTLPDHVQVWPAHGAGSACSKSLGAVPVTTVGYERTTAWWADHLANGDEEGFTRALLEGQPDAPLYFGRMKRWNKEGPALLGPSEAPEEASARDVAARLAAREVLFLDTRTMAEWHADPVDGALFVPFGGNFATYASYAIDPERDEQEIYVLASNAAQAAEMRAKLSWTGIDRFAGYVTDLAPFERGEIQVLEPAEVERRLGRTHVLDVRNATEHAGGHIDDAQQIHSGRVRWYLERIPQEGMIVHCQGGGRAAVAASILRRHGWSHVEELQGGYEGWSAFQREAQATPA
jgi:hydroxyacylglutathione hydrolase